MRIKFQLQTLGMPDIESFISVNLEDIKNAVQSSYLGLGTPYSPIVIDDFVNFMDNKLPVLLSKTQIKIELELDKSENNDKNFNPNLICLKAINVGRKFNDRKIIEIDFWQEVFNFEIGNLYAAPDSTLYISPTKKNETIMATNNKLPNLYVAYSILFSMKIRINEDHGYSDRTYYFTIDPLLHISSNQLT
ncbi:hypothetical protein [Aquimarina pacifica]|uniref:hypothetical protein n=1 Tax=Aquimarina pacifica TaxID=1296415 RepID=UPI000472A3BB|nr:hypothetical protein [Aquimarina pacifica]